MVYSSIKKNPDIVVRVFGLDWFKIISVLVKELTKIKVTKIRIQ